MNQNRLLQVLRAPHVSEKAALAADAANQYVFQVAPGATKPEIKKAVESLFGVSVESVQVLNRKGKAKRFGARAGRRSDLRKAYVKLKQGEEISFVGGE